MTLCPKVVDLFRAQGQEHVVVVVGGIVPESDIAKLHAAGHSRHLWARRHDRRHREAYPSGGERSRRAWPRRRGSPCVALTPPRVAGVLQGDRLQLARAITLVEDEHRYAHGLLAELYAHGGRGQIIGVTGSPGTGKSTLVTALAQQLRAAGQTVAIVAIDPTSPFTGGAILGDRVRMRALAGDSGVFIRSMATRGSLGGLSKTTGDVVTLLDAAGFDRIIVETVGVGQAEVEIASTAHTTLVVEAPGHGRRSPGDQSGHPRDRRHPRRQQGRSPRG